MKKMIPVYILQLIMVGTFAIVGYKLSRQLDAINSRVSTMIEDQRGETPFPTRPIRVEVVNTPTVDINGPVDVNVGDTLDVNVINEPTVDIAP